MKKLVAKTAITITLQPGDVFGLENISRAEEICILGLAEELAEKSGKDAKKIMPEKSAEQE